MRNKPWVVLAGALAALGLAACGSAGDEQTTKPYDDDGTIPVALLPAPQGEEAAVEGLEETLATAAKAEAGWVSAPWALAAPAVKDATELQIIYVAGDTTCYSAAGFTLDESNSKVTVGAYTLKVEGAQDCPANPAGAFKWGTIKLGQPLGERALVHAGVDEIYQDFSWGPFATAAAVEEPSPTTPAAGETAGGDEGAGQ
ncbi:MAG: hypothetical protein LBD51_04415 [Bifidobacteriaceae bacterium]|jgi:hypothetical protein|nr:hypothetical protein [Bifidobacteriaceae bacterium]